MRPVPRLLLLMTVALLALAVAPAAEAHDQPELRVAVRRTAAELVVTIEADDAARALAPDRRALVAHADGLVRATDADGATLVFASRGETDARFVLRAMAPVGDVVLALSLFGRDGGEAVVRIGDGEHERIAQAACQRQQWRKTAALQARRGVEMVCRGVGDRNQVAVGMCLRPQLCDQHDQRQGIGPTRMSPASNQSGLPWISGPAV